MSDNIFDKKVVQGMKDFTKYIAIVVRNAMEDFHCKHLSDEQMKELNPIIRNAIYTALYAYDAQKQSNMSKSFVDYHFMSIPKYWEEPEFVGGFKE
jgi:ribonuclease HIII